jgi:pyridoxamine 5'-phosphate oxidase
MAAPDPVAELVADRERARAAADPFTDLCILATAEATGPVGVRTVVLRDTGPEGVGLLISSTSPKWGPLERGRAECLLVWLTIRRQYRIRGRLGPMPEARVARYWGQKVHESRLLDLYYSRRQGQSTRVASREAFLRGIDELRQEHPTADAVPRPEALRGVYLRPERIEIWRGSPDRLHDRRLFELAEDGDGWRESVLVP